MSMSRKKGSSPKSKGEHRAPPPKKNNKNEVWERKKDWRGWVGFPFCLLVLRQQIYFSVLIIFSSPKVKHTLKKVFFSGRATKKGEGVEPP